MGHFSDFCPEGVHEGNTHNIIIEELAEEGDSPTNEDLEIVQAEGNEDAHIEDIKNSGREDAWVNMMDT